MTARLRLARLLPLLLALAAGCHPAHPGAAGARRGTLAHGGLLRSYLEQPPSRPPAGPLPVVLALHGGGGSAAGFDRLTDGRLGALAEREGILLVFPEGVEHGWNDGRGAARRRAQRDHVDDVGYVAALLDALGRAHRVDRSRVYVTGISNGGMMAHRLACELSDRVAAIAPVAAAMPEALAPSCAPRRPVPVLMIGGTEDPLVPWGGGEVHLGRRALGRVLAAEAVAHGWARRNGCAAAPRVTQLPDADPGDGTQTRVEARCEEQPERTVTTYVIAGGGHTWPGGRQYLPRLIVGRTSRDFDAAEAIWAFFKTRRLP